VGKVVSSLWRSTYGVVSGFITDGPKGALRGLGNFVSAYTGGPVGAALNTAAQVASAVSASAPSSKNAAPSVTRQALASSWIVYGKRRVGGLMVFFHPLFAGKYHYRFFVIAVAGHRCRGVTRWFLNDEQVTVRADGLVTSGKYKNDAWLWFGRGTDGNETPDTFVTDTNGKWTNAHAGRGVAKIFAKFRMTDDVIAAGMPNITAEIEGKDDIADPRTGVVAYTRNAALVFYDWLRLPREEGGFGAYDDEIDDDWVSAQANVCDEQVPLRSGGSEPRYAFDSYIQTGSAPSEVRDTFVNCCAGTFTYSGGKMLMRPGYYVPPSATLTEQDLAGPIMVPALRPGNDIVTEVTASYVDPVQYQPKDAPTRFVPTDDIRQGSLDLPHITSGTMAQRIAEIALRKSQAERRVQWPMNIVGISVAAMDTVKLATSRYGLSNYAFQIASWQLGQDFGVTLALEEHSPEIFDWTAAMELAIGEAPALESADPIGDAIPGGATQIIQASASVAYPVTSDDDSVTIAAFTAALSDGTTNFAFPAATITGLTAATAYLVIFDRSANAYVALTQPATGAEVVDPDNVIVRSIVTANADGTYPPEETPPGGDGGGGYGGGGGRVPNMVAQ
jgi:hypothetical protein